MAKETIGHLSQDTQNLISDIVHSGAQLTEQEDEIRALISEKTGIAEKDINLKIGSATVSIESDGQTLIFNTEKSTASVTPVGENTISDEEMAEIDKHAAEQEANNDTLEEAEDKVVDETWTVLEKCGVDVESLIDVKTNPNTALDNIPTLDECLQTDLTEAERSRIESVRKGLVENAKELTGTDPDAPLSNDDMKRSDERSLP